jgi:O-antigen/teichoic acid export membrane protein
MGNALRTAKNALMLFSGTATRMIATFAFIFYTANHLGARGFGQYSIIVHYFELFVSLSATAAGILLTRDVARWRRNRNKLFSSGVILVVILAMLAPILLIPIAMAFQYSRETIIGIGCASMGLIPAAVASLYEALFVATEKAEYVTVGSAIECLVRIGISLGLLLFGYGIVEISCVFVLSRTIQLAYYHYVMRRISHHKWDYSRRATGRFLKRWRVFAAENWMATIYMSLDVIVLSWLAGETAVGLYSAAWRYVRLGGVAARSFTTAVFPTLTRLYTESRETFLKVFRHTFRVMCMIALPVIGAVTVIPDRVVDLLFKKDYAGSAPILQVLIWVLLLEFLNPFLSHVLFSQGRQRYSMYVASIGLVTNSILVTLLVLKFGPVGAALACVVSGLIASMCYLYFTSELRLIGSMLVEFCRIFIASAAMAFAVSLVADQNWFVIFAVSISTYAVMLFLVQALRPHDMRILKNQVTRRAVA